MQTARDRILFTCKILFSVAVTIAVLPVSAEGLQELLHRVEQRAPLLMAASAQSDASEAGLRAARSQYWGHAEVFGRTARYDDDRIINPISFPPVLSKSLFDKTVYGYGASYTLPVDIGGRISAEVDAREYLSQAASQRTQQTRLSLFAAAVSLYRGLQQLEGDQQALGGQLKALQRHGKVAETSVRVGRIPAVELLRIEAEIKAIEGKLAGLDGAEARIRAELAALLNVESFVEPIEQLTVNPSSAMTEKLTDRSLEKRPDVRAAKSFTNAQKEFLKGTKREWMPDLGVHFEALRNEGKSAQGQNLWSVTAQATWQFVDGGKRHASTDVAQANHDQAQYQFQNTVNQARAQLQSAVAAWKAAALQHEAATSGLEAALESERIQSDRFASGRISAVDLIDAEAALARSRSDATGALAAWWLADDQLQLAKGNPPGAYNKVEANSVQ